MSKYLHKSPLSHICTNHSLRHIHSVNIWRCTSNSDLAITSFGAMPPGINTVTGILPSLHSLRIINLTEHLELWPGNHFIWCNATWNVPCISCSPNFYSGGLWDFIWWYAPCSIYIHDVYVDCNVPCIIYSPKCYCGHLWYFIWWYTPCSIYIYDVYVDWNVPCISYSPNFYSGGLWDL